VGLAGRETALSIFNPERFAAQWQEVLRELKII
jgi:hypothetical protein